MSPVFKYFDPENLDFSIDSFDRAFASLTLNPTIVDSAYLPVLEAAHRGCFEAVCEMADLFGTGAPGLPKNYSRARLYIDVIKDYNKGDPVTELEALSASGTLEYEFGNFEAAKSEFVEAAKLMINHLDAIDWNFNVFYHLQQIAKASKNPKEEIE